MTSAKLLQLARALTHCDFEDEILLMWLSHCENTLLTEVHLLSKEECRPIEAVSEEALTVPHPYDKLYLPYLQAQIHHAFGETDKYENFMALYNAYRDEYARKILSEIEPAYGEAIARGYYLSAYGIAKAHGYLGTEEEWLRSLQGISPRITIGEVRSGNVGEAAEATITGTDTDPVLNLVLPRGEQGSAGAAELGVAIGFIKDGVYIVSGDGLPYVKAGHNGAYEGKGKQIVFVPKEENPAGAALQINGGDTVEIRMRSSGDQLTEALPAGALRIGVPYTMTFCGMYWLVDNIAADCVSGTLKLFDEALRNFADADIVGMPVINPDAESGWYNMQIDAGDVSEYEKILQVPTVKRVQDIVRGIVVPTGRGNIYIGSGEMPEDCDIQIDPNGEILDIDAIVAAAVAEALKDIQIGDVSDEVIEQKIRAAIAELDIGGVSEEYVKTAIENALKEFEPPESGGGIDVSGAEVGQILRVKEVDENGVPTAWETAEMPTGGGADQFRLIRDITIPEDITTDSSGVNFIYADDEQTSVLFGFDTDDSGKPFELTELIVVTTNAGSIAANDTAGIRANFHSAIPITTSMGGAAILGVTKNSGKGHGINHITLLGDGNAMVTHTSFGGSAVNNITSPAKPTNMNISKIDKIRLCFQNGSKIGFTTGSQFRFYGR